MPPEPEFSVFRPDRPGIRKVLGDLEAEIMELVWVRPAGESVTVRDVFEVLGSRRAIAYTTVMNTMTRLARKRLLRVEKAGLAYVYYPGMTEEQFVSRMVGRVLQDLLVSFEGATLATLNELDPDAAERARAWLEEIARRRREGEES